MYGWSKKAKEDLQSKRREEMLSRSSNGTTVLSRMPTQTTFIIQGVSWSFFIAGDRGSGVQEGLNAQENLKLRWKAEKSRSVKCPYPVCSPCLGSMCAKEQAGVGSWIPFACSPMSVAPTLLLVGNSAQAIVCITKKQWSFVQKRSFVHRKWELL